MVIFYDIKLKHIDGGGYKEEFESDYIIREGNHISPSGLFGSFIVSSVTINTQTDVIDLLVSPDVRYSI